MNVKLTEWNNLLDYGNELCNKLKENGIDVRLKPYCTYDGRKGLSFQVFDKCGNLFTEYKSGVDTYNTMKYIMFLNAKRIYSGC